MHRVQHKPRSTEMYVIYFDSSVLFCDKITYYVYILFVIFNHVV